MPFHFTCPYCFKKTLVDESVAGQSGPCANCGKTIKVPEPPAKHADSINPVDSRYIPAASQKLNRRLTAWVLKACGFVVGVIAFSVMAIYFLWPTLTGLKARRDKVASLNNLQRIATALNEYAAVHGTYPPPVVFDAAGKPMYSWRVLILDQLGESTVAGRFRYDLPWDAPENVQALTLCPQVYIDPGATSRQTGSESNYVLLTGTNTVFPASGPLSPREISDGRENTVLIVETKNNMVEWTKPWDIDIAKLNTKIGASGPNSIGGNHAGGAAVVFVDGSLGWLPEDISPALLHGLITPDGGEPISAADYQLQQLR